MKWITRERPKIDRIACPWLIERFIDKTPEFLFVPAEKVLSEAKRTGAMPYDIPGVELSHDGPLCSFDAFLRKYALRDPALDQLALIVRGADTARLDLAPQAPGLLALSPGLSAVSADDHEMLRHGHVMYDALYAWCKSNRTRPIGGYRKLEPSAAQNAPAVGARAWSWAATVALFSAALARGARMLILPVIWQERYRARRMLRELTDHQLRDVGLSREQVERQARLPFWQP